MMNRSCGRGRPPRPVSARPAAPAEPPVRRWPHPVEGTEAPRPPESALHYIHCALSYQNQLLSEIKTLLEEMRLPQEEK